MNTSTKILAVCLCVSVVLLELTSAATTGTAQTSMASSMKTGSSRKHRLVLLELTSAATTGMAQTSMASSMKTGSSGQPSTSKQTTITMKTMTTGSTVSPSMAPKNGTSNVPPSMTTQGGSTGGSGTVQTTTPSSGTTLKWSVWNALLITIAAMLYKN